MNRVKSVIAAALVLSAASSVFAAKKAKTIKIGGVAPLSGAVAVYGVECKKGIDLAVEEINAAGGILGQTVEFVCWRLYSSMCISWYDDY